MSVRVNASRLVWTTLGERWDEHTWGGIIANLDRVLKAWEGTPYESGQRFRQRGADCIGAVFGVIDDCDGRQRGEFPDMPQDTAMHAPDTARAAVRRLIRLYAPAEKVLPAPDGNIYTEPGDVIVTAERGGGPGHVEFVGVRQNELWHALPSSGFHQGGWGFLGELHVCAVYRIQDKHRWRLTE